MGKVDFCYFYYNILDMNSERKAEIDALIIATGIDMDDYLSSIKPLVKMSKMIIEQDNIIDVQTKLYSSIVNDLCTFMTMSHITRDYLYHFGCTDFFNGPFLNSIIFFNQIDYERLYIRFLRQFLVFIADHRIISYHHAKTVDYSTITIQYVSRCGSKKQQIGWVFDTKQQDIDIDVYLATMAPPVIQQEVVGIHIHCI